MGNNLEQWRGQNLHHMLTGSPWEYSQLFKVILARSIKLLRSQKQRIYILIDEVGYRKKGKHSACVGQQYIGSIGKNDNGQVAVTAALSSQDFYCPVQMELFMPKDWETDFERRSKAGVPHNKTSESKTIIALRMIKHLFRPLSKDIECVVFDALYGYKLDFLWQLVSRKIPFVGDVRGKLAIYTCKPAMRIPVQGKGPKFTKKRPTKPSVLIKDYVDGLSKSEFQLLTVRNGTKGVIQSQYHMRRVWILHEPSNSFMSLYLLVRKDADGKIKYSLCFFNDQKVTISRLAKAQAQRAFVERVFEEGKNIVGMGDYQTRSWQGFHRHAALVSLSLLFLMEQKMKLRATIGKITAYHIQELVNATINTLCSLDQVIDRLVQQIPRYQKQIANHLKTVT